MLQFMQMQTLTLLIDTSIKKQCHHKSTDTHTSLVVQKSLFFPKRDQTCGENRAIRGWYNLLGHSSTKQLTMCDIMNRYGSDNADIDFHLKATRGNNFL